MNGVLFVFGVSCRRDVVGVSAPKILLAGRVNHTLPDWSIDKSCTSELLFGTGKLLKVPVTGSRLPIALAMCSTNQILPL